MDYNDDHLRPLSHALSNVHFNSTIYTKDAPIDLTVDLTSDTLTDHSLWLGFSIVDPMGKTIDLPLTEVQITHTGQQSLSVSPLIPSAIRPMIITGSYSAILALWENYPENEAVKPLDRIELTDAFRVYNTIEQFQTLDDTQWFSRNGVLGRSQLRNEHVAVRDDYLSITIPKNTLDGGEIQTTALTHYGSYEVRMKIPDAPSSLTGFFLYRSPDFHSEIDIEIFNQPESEVLFTSYSSGVIYHEERQPLSFDPTLSFHNYRIDYYSDRVVFYIDDHPVQTWRDGFTDEPMYLMVNTWFPNWLEGIAPLEDQTLEIEWIRY